ncbi:MAG: hypothetical protein WCF85_22435, partial [Rhodospirillaceae bacterium]
MLQASKIARAVIATLALSLAAGCAVTGPDSASAPELAGAWYQIYFDSNGAALDSRGQMIVHNVAYVAENSGTTRVTVIG